MRKLPPIIREFEVTQELPPLDKVNETLNGFEEVAHPNEQSKGNLNEELNSNLNIKPLNSASNIPFTTGEKVCLFVVPLLVALLILMVTLVIYLAPIDTTIVIMGTNDLHGKVYPTNLYREDNDQEYKYGGLVYMASIMEIMKKENPDRTLYLDAGDEFQGGIESSTLVSSGEIMNDFFSRAGLAGSAIGNHEFDFGPAFLFNYLNGRESPNLAANIQSEKGDKDFMPHQKGSELYEFQNNIKIGVIGLSTLETPITTATFINGKFPPYKFLAYKDQVVERSSLLRKQGANAVLIVSHVGNYCNSNFTNAVRTNETKSEECQDDEIAKLIDSLPEGTIDGVVQGHRHRISHHYRKNIPIIGTINGGYYLNFMYLTFNRNKELIKTSIEGPVPVCEKVFEKTQRCNYLQGQELENAGQLVNWAFHGTEVKADEKLQNTLNSKWSEKMSLYLERLVKNEVILERNGDKETELGNLFTNLLHAVVPDSDFTILNTGGFRTIWYPGVIDYEQFYNMFPFINQIVTFTMTGTELINTLNILQSGKEFFPTWNIQSTINIDSDLVRTVINSKFANGTAIDPNAVYKGASIDYLIIGGDRFSEVIGKVYTATAKAVLGEFRELMKPHLMNLSVIKENSLIDPLNPRFIIHNV